MLREERAIIRLGVTMGHLELEVSSPLLIPSKLHH
jgi:hypothetical protein